MCMGARRRITACARSASESAGESIHPVSVRQITSIFFLSISATPICVFAVLFRHPSIPWRRSAWNEMKSKVWGSSALTPAAPEGRAFIEASGSVSICACRSYDIGAFSSSFPDRPSRRSLSAPSSI
ncbi:hypothetical protein DFH08DRAFT_1073637, partial [Mycena albidolilacea]